MDVWIQQQEESWTRQLADLCEEDNIYVYNGKYPLESVQLRITDFPLQQEGKGMYGTIPFLVVSRENREEKILEAFEKGAEDYLVYPVSPKIARARIKRLLRVFAPERELLERIYGEIDFTPNEYGILSCLMKYPGKVFSRSELIEQALPGDYEGYDRNIDNYMKQIRRKIREHNGNPDCIQTVYGRGYRYEKSELSEFF